MPNRSTSANVQVQRRQLWVAGKRIQGIDALGLTPNANEQYLAQIGSTQGRVVHRTINAAVTCRAWDIDSYERLQRAISGYDPDIQISGLVIDPNYKNVLPCFVNVLNEEETAYTHSHYVRGGWNPLPVAPLSGAALDEQTYEFAGQTGGRVLDVQGGFAFTEKLPLTFTSVGLSYTAAATSVLAKYMTAPVGDATAAKILDAFMVLEPDSNHYSATAPTLCYPIPAGETVLGSVGGNTGTVAISKAQLGLMPDVFKAAYDTGANNLYVLLVGMSTEALAESDKSNIVFAPDKVPTDMWTDVS